MVKIFNEKFDSLDWRLVTIYDQQVQVALNILGHKLTHFCTRKFNLCFLELVSKACRNSTKWSRVTNSAAIGCPMMD